MSKKLFVLTSLALAAALLLSACVNPAADRPGKWYEIGRWFDTPLSVSLAEKCADGRAQALVGDGIYDCTGAPAGAPPYVAPEATLAPTPLAPAAPAATLAPEATAAPAFTQQWEVPDGRWTPALTENLVIELAVQIRPDRPWEGTVGPVEGQVYQFKTEYLDEDATTWQPGVHLYEFDLAAGWQPVFVGIQGDSPVQLCWMQEKGALGAQLLMKTMKGNGTSALVFFTKTDKVPANICP